MNWVRVQSQRLQQNMICHDGGTGGFRSFIAFTQDSRLGVMILSNSSVDVDDLAVALFRDFAKPPPSQDRTPNRRLVPLPDTGAGLDQN
jgi:hypothetical protein